MISEIRYIVRSLLRRKGFALVTVLTLALGIGSATAIYAVVDWILFQQPPSPKDTFLVGATGKDGTFSPWVWELQKRAYEGRKDIFSELGVAMYSAGNVVVNGKPALPGIEAVSPNLFGMIGATTAFGRGFVGGEDVDGKDLEVVVSYNFWRTSLGETPDPLGKKVVYDQQVFTVVGVLREGLRMPLFINSDVYKPLVIHYDPKNPWDPSLLILGHLAPGISRYQAELAMALIKPDFPASMQPFFTSSKPGLSDMGEMQKYFRPEVSWMLLGSVAFLYAIACLNATNLMLVHMLGKHREISIRLALGSSRWGLVRLLAIESLGLCACGSGIGALVANGLIPLFTSAARSQSEGLDWNLGMRTYCVLGGLTLVTGLLIALVPGIHVLRTNIQGGLKSGGGSIGETRGLARLRSAFVVLQATFAVILLVGAGLMVRTFHKLTEVDLGFDTRHRIKLSVNFPHNYPSESKARLAQLQLMQSALQKEPGVASVAFASDSLMAGYDFSSLSVQTANGDDLPVNGVYISSDYQDAGGITLKRGKWLSADAKGEVMINESLARTRFGSTDPVGLYLKPAQKNGSNDYLGWHIVGVVGDVREDVRKKSSSKVYMPIKWDPSVATTYLVNVKGPATGEVASRLRQVIYQCDPRVVSYSYIPIAELRKAQLSSEHLALSVLRVLGGIAIFLTVVGTFTLLAFTVDRRMGEFGIRMALGATPRHLIALVMAKGMTLTSVGVVLGIAGAVGLTRYLQSLLYESPPFDPLVVAAVAALLLGAALAACVLPALRASRPDITKLLKGD